MSSALFEKLAEATRSARTEKDLPDYLLVHIETLIANPDHYKAFTKEIEILIEQLQDFDLFAQTGYMPRGYTAFHLEGSLKKILGLDKISSR